MMHMHSVWQYITELTVAKECTIIITTHYIDEARRADTVRKIMLYVRMYVPSCDNRSVL